MISTITLVGLSIPGFLLGLSQAALITRTTNASMLEVLNAEYIKTARAKGVSEGKILWKHALRNAMIPIITVCGQSFAVLFGGAVVIEMIFNISGIGTLVYDSISNRDYSIIQGAVLVIALVYVVINLFVDILYGIEDPRVRVTGQKS